MMVGGLPMRAEGLGSKAVLCRNALETSTTRTITLIILVVLVMDQSSRCDVVERPRQAEADLAQAPAGVISDERIRPTGQRQVVAQVGDRFTEVHRRQLVAHSDPLSERRRSCQHLWTFLPAGGGSGDGMASEEVDTEEFADGDDLAAVSAFTTDASVSAP
jgi:hypothetical protein